MNRKRRLNLRNYAELHSWSTDPQTAGDFWVDLFEFEQLKKGLNPTKSMADLVSASQNECLSPQLTGQNVPMFPPPTFFPDVYMNFAEHLLEVPTTNPNGVALYAVPEGGGECRSVSKHELREKVKLAAGALVQAGVRKGDRVAAVISNCVEAIVVCLATLSLGALWSTSSPDMGVEGIMQRLNQIEPTVVLFESSVRYNGRLRDLTEKYQDCFTRLRRRTRKFTLGIVIERELPYRPAAAAAAAAAVTGANKPVSTSTWDAFLATSTGRRELTFEQLPFNHPGFIVYSSGTVSCDDAIQRPRSGGPRI